MALIMKGIQFQLKLPKKNLLNLVVEIAEVAEEVASNHVEVSLAEAAADFLVEDRTVEVLTEVVLTEEVQKEVAQTEDVQKEVVLTEADSKEASEEIKEAQKAASLKKEIEIFKQIKNGS